MVSWDDSILVGIPSVDSDHKSILDHINQFILDCEHEANTAAVHDSFRKMERRIYRHLFSEETMLEELGYPSRFDHKQAHADPLEELEKIWDDMLADLNFRPDEAARAWLESWLFEHVRKRDFLYRDWIREAGLDETAERYMAEAGGGRP